MWRMSGASAMMRDRTKANPFHREAPISDIALVLRAAKFAAQKHPAPRRKGNRQFALVGNASSEKTQTFESLIVLKLANSLACCIDWHRQNGGDRARGP